MLNDARRRRGRRPKAAREGKRGGKGTRISGRYGDLTGSDGAAASVEAVNAAASMGNDARLHRDTSALWGFGHGVRWGGRF